jgi:hypothetical protein
LYPISPENNYSYDEQHFHLDESVNTFKENLQQEINRILYRKRIKGHSHPLRRNKIRRNGRRRGTDYRQITTGPATHPALNQHDAEVNELLQLKYSFWQKMITKIIVFNQEINNAFGGSHQNFISSYTG